MSNRMPGFHADAAVGARPSQAMMGTLAFDGADWGAVLAAQDTSIGPDVSTCAATTVCGPCMRFCVPRFGCFAFKQCHCTTKDGGTRYFAQAC
jgi:hypothetical protein